MTGGATRERGEAVWDWVRRIGCGAIFAYSAIWKENPNFVVVFLAMSGAVFPAREFRALLRTWRRNDDQT